MLIPASVRISTEHVISRLWCMHRVAYHAKTVSGFHVPRGNVHLELYDCGRARKALKHLAELLLLNC